MNTVTKSIIHFILKTALVISPVLAAASLWYVIEDPYKVLRHYDCYLPDPDENPLRLGLNKEMITINNLNDRLAEGRIYDAFIFGSSVSCYYDALSWVSLADSTGSAKPYHFDSSNESLLSLADKFEYLDRKDIAIKYALIVLDPVIMSKDKPDGPAEMETPMLDNSILNLARFHYNYFRAATNADFLKSWIPAQVNGKPYYGGRNMIFETQPIVHDPLTNQETIPQWDYMISQSPEKYYARHRLIESPDSVTTSDSAIDSRKADALRRVARIIKKHGTDYRIIIGPNRLKKALNPLDLQQMEEIFQACRIHDFSSSMAGMLECDTMLYDNVHYRPAFALHMMQTAYDSNR